MVKSCVGGGWEENFSEHPDAVRIFVCGFCVRIFVCGFSRGFLCADFRADFEFFACGFHVRVLTRAFLRIFWARRLHGERQKILQ